MTATMSEAVVEGRLVRAEVGSVVEHPTGRYERLVACEDWDEAAFRFPSPIGCSGQPMYPAWACNIEITGRTFQFRKGDYWVRVTIIAVGDGEPDRRMSGWLRVWPCDCPVVE